MCWPADGRGITILNLVERFFLPNHGHITFERKRTLPRSSWTITGTPSPWLARILCCTAPRSVTISPWGCEQEVSDQQLSWLLARTPILVNLSCPCRQALSTLIQPVSWFVRGKAVALQRRTRNCHRHCHGRAASVVANSSASRHCPCRCCAIHRSSSLDEATSALDVESGESSCRKRWTRRCENRTTIANRAIG